MRRIMFLGVVLLALAGIFACSTSSSGTTPHVYIGGQVGTSSSSTLPVYWKDGTLNMLPLNGATNGGAFAIADDASGNIYVAGGTSTSPVGYWKNTTYVPLSLGTSNTVGYLAGIAVDTSGNVWLVGEVGSSSPTTFVYWENSGAPTPLPGGPDNAYVVNADTAGNVYFLGTINVSSNDIPYVWKNGANQTALPLSTSYTHGFPGSLAVDSSGNLYVLGQQYGGGNSVVVAWKNVGGVWQNPVAFNAGTYFASGSWYAQTLGGAIDSSGNLHTAMTYGDPTPSSFVSWSSVSSAPSTGTNPSGTKVWAGDGSFALDSSDNLYVAGQVGTTLSSGNGSRLSDGVPVYWKNGTGTALPMGTGNMWGLAGWVVVGK
jgi:hypothetical protein